MAVCFLLFFAVNPITAVIVGMFSGRNIKASWFQPILLAVLFLLGTWMFFDIGELAFVFYAVGYFVISMVSMFLSSWLSARGQQ